MSALALPYFGRHMTLDVNACYIQIECVLLQQQADSLTMPVGY